MEKADDGRPHADHEPDIGGADQANAARGIISDCRFFGLFAADASIDWLRFRRLLDRRRGGHFPLQGRQVEARRPLTVRSRGQGDRVKTKKTNKKAVARAVTNEEPAKLPAKEYRRALRDLHVELVKLQEWVKQEGLKVCVVFEGRDTAGKGGTIKAITERVSPRVFRVIALPAPTEREKSQMYVQRYLPLLPAAGEIVIFDRSWYNRAGVERVMGFTDEETARKFLKVVPLVEKAIVDSGVILIKYWLEVSEAEQTRRLQARIDDGRKIWKLSPMDLLSYSRWYDYSRARDEMFEATDTPFAPWFVVRTDDKKRARLNTISDLLSRVPYKKIRRAKVKLPERQKRGNYREPDYPWRRVEERY